MLQRIVTVTDAAVFVSIGDTFIHIPTERFDYLVKVTFEKMDGTVDRAPEVIKRKVTK